MTCASSKGQLFSPPKASECLLNFWCHGWSGNSSGTMPEVLLDENFKWSKLKSHRKDPPSDDLGHASVGDTEEAGDPTHGGALLTHVDD